MSGSGGGVQGLPGEFYFTTSMPDKHRRLLSAFQASAHFISCDCDVKINLKQLAFSCLFLLIL